MTCRFLILPRPTTLAVLALIVLTGTLAFAVSHRPGDAPTSQGPLDRGSAEVELVTLRPSGFEPAEMTRPAGRFLLAVTNRSGLREVTLRLSRLAGGGAREVRLPRGRRLWREALDLPPGQYALSVAEQPRWVCRITLTP